MAFLNWLGSLVLTFVWNKVVAFVSATIAFLSRKQTIDTESQDSVKPLEGATTGEEIDKASDDALSGF